MGNMMLAAHSLGLGSIWIHRAKEEFEMSEYQKAMVRQVLEARRLYQRTGTPLYIHERSVSILRKMKNETKQCGVYVKQRETRKVQKELIKTMQQRRKKQL